MTWLFTSCPLPKVCRWRAVGDDFPPYPITKTFFSVHAGVCFKAHVGRSAVLFPIRPLSKLPSVYNVLRLLPSVFLLVHLLRAVFSEWVHVINPHLGKIFTIQQSNKKKHTFQMQQLKESKLTHGLKSPKWTGCQTTVSTSNFLGSKVEFISILLITFSSGDSLLTAAEWSSVMACSFCAGR